MKKILFSAFFALICVFSFGQGLDGIVVDQLDASAASPGATAYRVYVDMAPGYQLQAVFGDATNPLTVNTTTGWYNSPFGGATGNSLSDALLGTFPEAAFDSYISMNAATSARIGVPVADDSDGTADGITTGTPSAVTEAGITPTTNFAAGATGMSFDINSATGGSWATTDDNSDATPNNTVLIGQFTTDGDLAFALNIQIRSAAGVVEQYFASSTAELNFPAPILGCTDAAACNYNAAATLDDGNCLLGDAANCLLCGDASGDLGANPSDSPVVTDGTGTVVDNDVLPAGGDGICDNTQFTACTDPTACNYNNDPAALSDAASCEFAAPNCFECVGNATDGTGSAQIIDADNDGVCDADEIAGCTSSTACNYDAAATDDDGSCNEPDPACETCVGGVPQLDPAQDLNNNGICDADEAGYVFAELSQSCDDVDFCLPFQSKLAIADVNGFDLQINYDPAQVTPTGNVIVYAQADIDPINVSFSSFIPTAGTMYLSVYLLPSAPSSHQWTVAALTDILCIEFSNNAGFVSGTSAIDLPEVIESYTNAPFQVYNTNTSGSIEVTASTAHTGNLQFWNGFGPIQYDAANPGTYAATDIYGNDAACAAQSATSVQPDVVGSFVYDTNNGANVEIIRDVPNTASVLSVINGFDALLALQVTLNNPPALNDYQYIAADVNRDGGITAGDVSQINQRTVLAIGEYNQVNPQRDWIFVDATQASTFGTVDRFNVPVVDLCLPVPAAVDCQIPDEDYIGILIGDVDGSWVNAPIDGVLKTVATGKETEAKSNNAKVIIDFVQATEENGTITIPVSFENIDPINTLDFELMFDTDLMTYDSYESLVGFDFESVNFNEDDLTLRATTGAVTAYSDSPVMNLVFTTSDVVDYTDFMPVTAVIDGTIVPIEVSSVVSVEEINVETNIYPNPTNDIVNITVSENAFVQVLDVAGKAVSISTNVNANQLEQIDLGSLESGIYLINVYGDNFSTFEKIVKK